MAKGRASFLKRERERQKTEKAAMKRERRGQPGDAPGDTSRVATRDDLDAYGIVRQGSDDEPQDQR